jgi:hypothetical protein
MTPQWVSWVPLFHITFFTAVGAAQYHLSDPLADATLTRYTSLKYYITEYHNKKGENFLKVGNFDSGSTEYPILPNISMSSKFGYQQNAVLPHQLALV